MVWGGSQSIVNRYVSILGNKSKVFETYNAKAF